MDAVARTRAGSGTRMGLRVARHLIHVLNRAFAGLIARMRLAGQDNLHRAGGVVDQRVEAIEIAEQQVAALVEGEAPGEADGEGLGVQPLLDGLLRRPRRAAPPAATGTAARRPAASEP